MRNSFFNTGSRPGERKSLPCTMRQACRAAYGAHLLDAIAERLAVKGVAGVAVRSLGLYQ
ncbi:MAG: hypothetical protein HY066_13745 [Betaproteobacteria bacterium]|nr:hypothetical protein [Betaproteobacteria bacterium]